MFRVDLSTAVRRSAATLATAVLTCAPLACGPAGPEKATVWGTVTYAGKPVPKGTISFVPTTPDGHSATGEIQPDGSYTLQTETPKDGALLGDYDVAVSARDEPVLDYTPPKPVKPKRLAPAKYENPKTSGLKATVKSGRNELKFDLTD